MTTGVNFTRPDAGRIGNSVRDFENRPQNLPELLRRFGKRQLVFAKVTGSTADEYSATEQIWDDSTSAFIDLTGGRIWDGATNLTQIREINGLSGVPDDTIINPFYMGDNVGNTLWFFNFSGTGAFIVEITGASTGDESGPYPGKVYAADPTGAFTNVSNIRIAQVATGTGHEFPSGTRALGVLKNNAYWMQPAVFT